MPVPVNNGDHADHYVSERLWTLLIN